MKTKRNPKIWAKGKMSKKKSNLEGLGRGACGFDKEFIAESFALPPPHAKTRWQRAKRRPGRPLKGKWRQGDLRQRGKGTLIPLG